MLRHIIAVLCVTSVLCHQDLKLPEGASCEWNGLQGRCVSAFRCLSTVLDFEQRNPPPLCTFSGRTPIICCTDCELVEDTRLYIFDKHLGILIKSGTSKAKDRCIDYVHEQDYQDKLYIPYVTFSKDFGPAKNCTIFKQYWPPYGRGASGGQDAKRGQFPHMNALTSYTP